MVRRSNRNKMDKSTTAKTTIEFDYLGIDKKYGRKTKKPITKVSKNEILVQVETRPTEVTSIDDQSTALASSVSKTTDDSHTEINSSKTTHEKLLSQTKTGPAAEIRVTNDNNPSPQTSHGAQMDSPISITTNQVGKKVDQPIVHGHTSATASTVSVDIRSNDALSYAMGSYATDALSGNRYSQKYHPNFETNMSHQQFDPSLMELFSMREAINSMSDSNMETNPNNYVAANLNFDNIHQSRGATGMPINSQNNIDYYNQNFGPFPYVYPNSLGSVISDGYYLDSLVEERRRRNSTVENYSVDRPPVRHN